MKWLSNRISFHRHSEYTTILISTKVEKWKEGVLLAWMVLWLFVGGAILGVALSEDYLNRIAGDTPKSQLQLFLLLFLVFWGYYLYKIIKVYLWRKKGVEYLKLNKESLVIKRGYGKFGKAHSYFLTNMSSIELLERSVRSYSWVMQSAFWDIGNESLEFEYQGKKIIFGVQLEVEETKKLRQFLRTEIRKIEIEKRPKKK